MGVFKKVAWVAGGLFVLAVIGSMGEGVPSDPTLSLITAGKRRVQERLKDPESARFGNVWTPDTMVVCGYVNSKNSFGGYSGDELFYGMGSLIYFDNDLKEMTKEEQKLPREMRAKCEGK
jgi:hypothetical protein